MSKATPFSLSAIITLRPKGLGPLLISFILPSGTGQLTGAGLCCY